jgi:hypothetical protein
MSTPTTDDPGTPPELDDPKTIEDRCRSILKSETPDRGRFRVLAERSGLTESNWKSFFYDRQRPNPEMLGWVCEEWPQYTMWMMTGVERPEIGQTRPLSVVNPKGVILAFPEMTAVEAEELMASLNHSGTACRLVTGPHSERILRELRQDTSEINPGDTLER